MFKSSFSKYLTAFVAIILISFLLISGIITSLIRAHVITDKVDKLELSTSILRRHFEEKGVEQLENYISSDFGANVVALFPLVNVDYDFNIFITDAEGGLLLSTVAPDEDHSDKTVDLSIFEKVTNSEEEEYLVANGVFSGILDTPSMVYGSPVMTGGVLRGYVFTSAATGTEDRLIGVARRSVINGSVWVMLAALVAAYFIADRIVHPLKSMTGAVKKFAKGDFSERITVTGRDEVAELALAFNNMAESLENLEKMRNSFLASVSHDLRTPMTTIAGYIDGINSGAIPPEKQAHYLGIISGEVHRLSRLVSQILDVSRLDSGDRKFVLGDFDVAEVARQIIISFESKLYEKKLDVEFVSEDSVFVHADQDAIYQVLYNLCHNAIKFSDVGGRFILKIEKKDAKLVRVSVYDDGQSMTEEDAAHAFDRFYKSDKSRGLDKNGVGLGLYISKSIIDAHEQEIGVDVKENGCEFWFTLALGEATLKHRG